jgi:hypothetical protein
MDRLKQIIFDIYIDIYENTIPRGDFMAMYSQSEYLPNGNKDILCNLYTIDSDLMDDIIKKHMVQHNLSENDRKIILMEMSFGYVPLRSFVKDKNYE